MAVQTKLFHFNIDRWLSPYWWFCFVSLCVLMTYTQLENLESGGFSYWLLILSVVIFPLLTLRSTVDSSLKSALLVTLYALISGVWFLFKGDIKVVMQLGLFTLGTVWISSNRANLNIHTLAYLYILIVFVGVIVNLTTQISPYGLFPGYTMSDFGVWRVSFFPNVAYTGLLSLALVLILTQDAKIAKAHPYILILAIYFLTFSIVRSALVGISVYILLRWWFTNFGSRMNRVSLFWFTLLTAILLNIIIAYSPALIVGLQSLPLVSEIFLQGKVELSSEEIYNQIYRPWLWQQQISFFINSPFLMGLGSFEFADAVVVNSASQIVSAGTESLLTRMLSVYGLPTVLFLIFLVIQLKKHSDSRDYWACACFPVVILLMMNWGSVFHPSDAMFLLYMMILIRGRPGFSS